MRGGNSSALSPMWDEYSPSFFIFRGPLRACHYFSRQLPVAPSSSTTCLFHSFILSRWTQTQTRLFFFFFMQLASSRYLYIVECIAIWRGGNVPASFLPFCWQPSPHKHTRHIFLPLFQLLSLSSSSLLLLSCTREAVCPPTTPSITSPPLLRLPSDGWEIG